MYPLSLKSSNAQPVTEPLAADADCMPPRVTIDSATKVAVTAVAVTLRARLENFDLDIRAFRMG